MTGDYLCVVCDEPIVDEDPHTACDGEDVHECCCKICQRDELAGAIADVLGRYAGAREENQQIFAIDEVATIAADVALDLEVAIPAPSDALWTNEVRRRVATVDTKGRL